MYTLYLLYIIYVIYMEPYMYVYIYFHTLASSPQWSSWVISTKLSSNTFQSLPSFQFRILLYKTNMPIR